VLAKIILFTYILIGASLFGQKSECNIVLKGLVYDTIDNEIIHFVSIEVLNNNKNISILNKDGEFIIENICKGIVNIHFSHLDCEHLDLSFYITKDTFIGVHLPHTLLKVGNAKVIAKTEKNNELLKVSLRQIELSKGQSIAEIMQGITGVSLLKTGGNIAKPVINGLHGNRVIILNNGIRQEGQNWGMEHAPEIDGFLATDIQLLKGNEALRYAADGIGGVLLVKPFSLFNYKAKKLKGEINSIYNTNGRGYGFSGIIGNKISNKVPIFWRIQGTYKRSGNIKTPSYFLANTGAKEINYSASLGYQNRRLNSEVFFSYFSNEIAIFTGSHIGNLTDLQRAFMLNINY
jgi:iron complex outermembrane recepter protein